MIWLWLRSLFYLLLVGGGWLILLPAGLLYASSSEMDIGLRSIWFVAAGAFAAALGIALALWSGVRLICDGKGTPFPLDPTRRLVTNGPYAFIRNPQGVGLLFIASAEVLIIDSQTLCLLPFLTVIYLVAIAQPFEDWELNRRFGDEYQEYRKRVPRWIPCGVGRSRIRLPW